MSAWRTRLGALVPVPLAAPESWALRKLRCSIVCALALLGSVCLFWNDLIGVVGIFAAALVIALVIYLMVVVPVWLCMKVRADDAWLLRERDND